MNEDIKISIEIMPRAADIELLHQGNHDHNTKNSGGAEAQTLAIFLRNWNDEVVGGIAGWTAYGWLRIDVLWVAENLRGSGLGKQLMSAAETEGVRRGCKFATLDSFNFQAAEMYKKFGYSEFAKLDLLVGNQTWHFFKKELLS